MLGRIKLNLIVVVLFVLPQICYSQTDKKWTVFLFGGLNGQTTYTTTSGPAMFSDKTSRSFGVMSEKELYKNNNIALTAGINGRLYLANASFLTWVFFPDNIYSEYPITDFWKGGPYFWNWDQIVLEFPLGLNYSIDLGNKYSIQTTLKVVPSIYFETVNYTSESFVEWPLESNQFHKRFTLYREYDDFNDRTIELSNPKLEFEPSIRVKKELDNYGSILFGALHRFGTQKLSTSEIVAYEFIPEITSTGTFERNMSFTAIQVGFEFGKNNNTLYNN